MNSGSDTSVKNDTLRRVEATLAGRYAAERRFRRYGLLAVSIGIAFLLFLFISIAANGYTAFVQTRVALDIDFDASIIDPAGQRDPGTLGLADYQKLIRNALGAKFAEVKSRGDKRRLNRLISGNANFDLRDLVLADPERIGQRQTVWLLADDEVDMYFKGHVDTDLAEKRRRLKDKEIEWLDALAADGRVERYFNIGFFRHGDSRNPEVAGIWGAMVGSFYMLLVTLLISFPIGVAAAIYLEEFAPRNRWTDLVEVNINNLAAVPSIVFGLLGLAVFINFFGLPRSAPLVGGLVLSLMTLPVIIIAGRAAIKSVPPSVREAALALGASQMQTVMHHVLPLAMPGMLTGAIIGMARALGESAPLLMIGMVAFIVEVPGSPLDPASALPVQVYLWADSPERAFVERTSAAILVLLTFLLVMNAAAVLLRNKFERRW